MKTIYDTISHNPFFKDISTDRLELIASYGQDIYVKAGQYFVHEGDDADAFYIIRDGIVSIEIHIPQQGAKKIQTLGADDIAGWSWIFPPHKWNFDLKALSDTSAIRLDGKKLRRRCEADTKLGYLLMKQFARVMTERLKAARFHLLDLYRGEDND